MRNGLLLWADDEIDHLKAHVIFLQKKGYEVVTVSNGRDAVAQCQEHTFDLVLLDEMMPGLSGLETLQLIKEVQPNVPVVMVTKSEEEDIMNQAIGKKIADYLIKPVNPNQILLSLKKNIHHKELVAEVTQMDYQQSFQQIAMQIADCRTWQDWTEVYRRLVHWELELAQLPTHNSPLLDNDVESICIDGKTGEVFFGTASGLCSYMGDATEPSDEMTKDNVYAFPNPVRPDYTGPITVTGLTINADVKIVTANGALVAEGRSSGGTFTWDGCDKRGKRVASGVYMVETATQDGGKGTVCKIAIVN